VGRAFIATRSDGAVRMVLSSLPRAHQLSWPRLRRSWLPQLRSFVAPATAGIRASVDASFCEASEPNLVSHKLGAPHFGRGSFLTFESPCRGLIDAIESAHLPLDTADMFRLKPYGASGDNSSNPDKSSGPNST
jgi:hypothetical protein